MAKRWSGDDEEFLLDQFDDMMMREELSGKFDAGISTVEKIDRLSQKTDRKRAIKDDPLKKYGYVVRSFILENIREINYRDIAALVGVPEEELKEAVEKMGIKVTEDKVKRWEELHIQEYGGVADCARCQVQRRHSTFLVGYENCRKCYEENIKHWIAHNQPIRLMFLEKD
jgi:hypothetical protein